MMPAVLVAASPEVHGVNFWGGRTFVSGHGPAWPDNHGSQRHQRWERRGGSAAADGVADHGPPRASDGGAERGLPAADRPAVGGAPGFHSLPVA
ncbi:hypothetical protein [Nonomuraea jabiensis]|uniref:hypothetical protein n=1 Tax=Nonomuraea jabiensis TaxID=882448 RepID=UPI0036A69028